MSCRDNDKQVTQTKDAEGKAADRQPADKTSKETTAPQGSAPAGSPAPPPGWPGFQTPPPRQDSGAMPVAGGMKQQEQPPGHRIGQILEPALWTVAFLLLCTAIVVFFQAFRKRSKITKDTLQEQLSQFRDAYEKGQMSKEEYHRVHALLTTRIRDKLKTAENSAAAGAESGAINAAAESAAPGTPGATDAGNVASQEKTVQDNGPR
jgi:hypothetical protein